MFVNLPGVRPGGPAQGLESADSEPVCEECSQAKNSLHCIDASIQVDLSDGEESAEDNAMGRKGEEGRRSMPMYSREDIREQYCINDKELQVLDNKRKKGILGCFSDNGQSGMSPCTRHGKKSLLTSCIGKSGSDDDLPGLSKDQRPVSPGKTSHTWTGNSYRSGAPDEDDGFDENYFRRRPKSFCLEGRRYGTMEPGMRMSQMSIADENYIRSMTMGYTPGQVPQLRPPHMMMGFPGYSPYHSQASSRPDMSMSQELYSQQATQPNTPDLLLHRKAVNDSEVSLDDRKQKHVSFDSSSILRSQTVGNMTETEVQKQMNSSKAAQPSTPSKSSERLLDGRKTPDYAMYSELFTPELARQIVLERLKRSSMRTQATQTDVKKNLVQNPNIQVPTSPRLQQKSWMVSESVQTNGLVSPPNHSSNLPPNWYGQGRPYAVQTLPNRGHPQQYQVQVYNLDSPIGSHSPKNFIPQCTSSPLSHLKGQNSSSQTSGPPQMQEPISRGKVKSVRSSNCQSFEPVYGKVREPLYCQSSGPLICSTKDSNRTLTKMSSNSSEKNRSMSSDNILDSESGYGSATQGYQVLKDDYNIHVVQSNIDSKRTRLRKSISSDGLLSGIPNSPEMTRQKNICGETDRNIDIMDRKVSIMGASDPDTGPSESELPELAPVIQTKSKQRRQTSNVCSEASDVLQDDVSNMGGRVNNGAYSRITTDIVLQEIPPSSISGADVIDNIVELKDQVCKGDCDEGVPTANAELSMRLKLSPPGSNGSIHEIAETVNLENTWTESQVTVLSKQSPKSGDEKLSQSSLATSIERTESLSSETLCREEMDSKILKDPMLINLDKQPYQDLLPKCELAEENKNTLVKCLDSEAQSQISSKSSEILLKNNNSSCDPNICRSDSGNSGSGKTNETSTSDEFYTALEYSTKSTKGELDASLLGSNCLSPHKVLDEEISIKETYDEKPPVPLITAECSDIIHSEASDFKFFIPDHEDQFEKNSESLAEKGLNIEPVISQSSLCELKSPASESSSSSGSYSVTTDSGPNILALANFSLANNNSGHVKSPLVITKDSKSEADIIVKEVKSETEDIGVSMGNKMPVLELSNVVVPKTKNQEDWTDVEKSQRKQCMKLNLPHEITSNNNKSETSSVWQKEKNGSVKTKCTFDEEISYENTQLALSKMNPSAKDGSKTSKTPSSIPRGILEDSFTQSPTLARSPAMHEGFHLKDWKVERTPINTPDASVLTSRLPQLSDDDEEIESESLNSETDPISKGSGTSSFLPSSIDVSESRATSSIPEQEFFKQISIEEKVNTILIGAKQEKDDKNIIDTKLVTIVHEESLIPLVKPPAGFTDSPVKSTQEVFSIKSIVENEIEDNQEILIVDDSDVTKVHELYNISNVKSEIISEVETVASEHFDNLIFKQTSDISVTSQPNYPKKESYQHPELVVCQRQELPEVMMAAIPEDRTRKSSSSTGTGSRSSSRARQKSRSRSRSKSSERMLQKLDPIEYDIDQGIYVGEYQKQAWVFVGEITNLHVDSLNEIGTTIPLKRSASIESTQSEKEFTKKYQAITHRMVHRKSSAIMYSRILDRTFECNKTVIVQRVEGEFGFRIHGSRPVVVSAIEPGTPAQSSGLSVGDILLTINGVNVLDLPHTQVVRVAQKCPDALELGVARTDDVTERGSVWDQLSLSKEVLAQGCLWKRKRSVVPNQQWARRWFILRADDCLYSFKSENEIKPSGALLLPGCTIRQMEPLEDHNHSLQITRPDGSTVWLAADSDQDCMEWKDLLSIAASRRRSQNDIWLDVARHRSMLPALSHASPDCRGYLNQLVGGSWSRNMLVLLDGCLYVYSDQDLESSTTGVIFLHGYKAQSGNIGGKRHSFEMIPTDQNLNHFYFHAQTETEKKRWLAALEYSIDRWMRLS